MPTTSLLMRLRRMGHEGSALDIFSPALRAVASDFLLAQEVTKKAFPHQSDRCAVALGSVARSDGPPQMGHPCPAAAAPSSLMALLTLLPHLSGLKGEPIPCPFATSVAAFGIHPCLATWHDGFTSANQRGSQYSAPSQPRLLHSVYIPVSRPGLMASTWRIRREPIPCPTDTLTDTGCIDVAADRP